MRYFHSGYVTPRSSHIHSRSQPYIELYIFDWITSRSPRKPKPSITHIISFHYFKEHRFVENFWYYPRVSSHHPGRLQNTENKPQEAKENKKKTQKQKQKEIAPLCVCYVCISRAENTRNRPITPTKRT